MTAGWLAAACVDGSQLGGGGEDKSMFATEIAPIFEQDCGTNACHAAEGDRYDELDPSWFVFPVDEDGRITGSERLEKAYARAVEKLSAAGPEFSPLVRKPLDEALGGQAHRGGSQYRTMSDERLQKLMHWARVAAPLEDVPLSPLAQRYRDEIEPILAEKRCMLSSCHGASASNLLIFDPGVVGRFDNAASLANYKKVITHLNLETPDPMMSRLVRKTIPLDQGGIFHRGGNDFFNPAARDEKLQKILDFVTDARTAVGADGTGVVTGIVFASTDPTPRRWFDLSVWQPGGDIYLLSPPEPGGQLTNLTAAHHTGPADIRDPAVSYDGTRIAFAMRRSEEDCLNLYVMNLDGSNLQQLTFDTGTLPNGIKVSNVEPLWGPDDRIYFVSTRAGQWAANGDYPLSNIWRIDPASGELLRMTMSAGNEISPAWRRFPAKGKQAIENRTLDLTFTATRKVGDRMFAPLMRVPPDFRADYHPHFGTQNPNYQIFTSMTQFPDLREPLILSDEAVVWEGGALALIDRNLGPIIKDGGEPSVVNYVDPLQKLGAVGDVVEHTGVSPDGYYRDPYALPDGRIVVAHSPDTIDLTDPTATPDTAIYRLELRELKGNRTVVVRKEVLADIPGKVEMDPRPVMVRRREEIGDPLEHLSNDVDHGTLLNFDLAVAMTVAAEDSPSRGKPFDEMASKIRYVRLVEEIAPDGTAVGRAARGMRRVLAEFPATTDRSVYVELPAGVPFFIQTLDDMRMATATFNQWFFVLPGEHLKQVTRREVWNTRCGACHGSKSGEPGDTVTTPDVLTQASRVVANYDAATRTDKPPVPYGLEPDERLEVDFARDVQPILTARCATAGCHDGTVAPDLTDRPGVEFSGAYEALTAPGADSANGFAYVDPMSSSARRSYLAEVLLGRDLDAPRAYDSTGCPGAGQMSLTELATLMRWMDLGAAYRGIGPKTKPELPSY
ncbi:MAG: hypothetical protein D6689_05930 [Deltaproteobacteria bacterium]|nr:MAG: hypothetical protein D6689_05930 [Deltaproteobacteria bacterium]